MSKIPVFYRPEQNAPQQGTSPSPQKPEYVVTTSEFHDVKGRLMSVLNRRKPAEQDPNRPKLRKQGSGRIDSDGNEKPKAEDEDERPTLKRRN